MSWRAHDKAVLPTFLSRENAEAFFAARALMFDLNTELLRRAFLAHHITDPASPDDALPEVGEDRMLFRYPNESNDDYRARLDTSWSIWPGSTNWSGCAGTEAGLEAQALAASHTVTVVVDPAGSHNGLPNYWSQFYIAAPLSALSDTATLLAIVAQFKPVDHVFRGFVWPDGGAEAAAFGEEAFGEGEFG